jgi:hypothetical protein
MARTSYQGAIVVLVATVVANETVAVHRSHWNTDRDYSGASVAYSYTYS